MFQPRLRAVLGPTNTGKTHLAITRLLAHGSGIIGFPLRLLARENYDRMVSLRGVNAVALITGEEKIVPPNARYFSCTAEAMPLDRPVEFVAVDEIQLAADPDRGHVFTERLLRARGLSETMFLGAETIRNLLQRLVPGIEIETRPRLSTLSYAGAAKLSRLPPRSAIVAFSATEVYAIAEAIRRRSGGCAVVMGRLSPRTRNAQVALYQQGEVDFLVATDAIGMGLNMDVDHVGFANLRKFDGHRPRLLRAAEIAQIAGRAGRGMRDGSFGTTGTCDPLSPELAEAVEQHRFDALETLAWRNPDLDFSHIDALLASLNRAPPNAALFRGEEASDVETLAHLAHDPAIRDMARGRARLRLLWDACQVPDFRKLADDTHAKLCGRIFTHLVQDRALPEDWLASQFTALDRTEGDLDTLMARLGGVRVWSYIAQRAEWLRDADRWAARARDVEEHLSDALHERLTARFVDKRAAHLVRRLAQGETAPEILSAVTAAGVVVVEGHQVGRIDGFAFRPDPDALGADKRLVERAARRALAAEMPRRVRLLVAADDCAFTLQDDAKLAWAGVPVARLKAGPGILRPQIDVFQSDFFEGAAREDIRARLMAFMARRIAADLAPLVAAELAARQWPELRGVMHRLRDGGGVVPRFDTAQFDKAQFDKAQFDTAQFDKAQFDKAQFDKAQFDKVQFDKAQFAKVGPENSALEKIGLDSVGVEDTSPLLRGRLKTIGVRAGRFALFMPALLKPRASALRAVLLAVHGGGAPLVVPPPGQVSRALQGADNRLVSLGFYAAGPYLLRLDVAERMAADLAYITRRGGAPLPPGLAQRLGVPAASLPAVLHGLGFRLPPAPVLGAGVYGPPLPALITAVRRRAPRGEAAPAKPRAAQHPDHPFAALAAWQA